MHRISAGEFTLEVIDPVADRARLGPRYCWGGYVYQAYASDGRPLLSGPQYPSPSPIPFHGQGIPEVFRFWNKQTRQLLNVADGAGLIIGVGEVEMAPGAEEPQAMIREPCAWTTETVTDGIRMSTRHGVNGWGYELTRGILGAGQTIVSRSSLVCTGKKDLQVQWFPHPFFPLLNAGMEFSIRPPVCVAENPGFACSGDGQFAMRRARDWQNGHFEWFVGDYVEPLQARFQHPVTGSVTMSGAFPIEYMPVWANASTISIEPHASYTLAPGEGAAWDLEYRFGD